MSELPLATGARGPAVTDLQQRLAALGFVASADEAGVFGSATADAVRRFQRARGLRADGTCGPQTWTALVEAGYRIGDRWLYLTHPMLRGDDVGVLQRRLSALGFHPGRVDGIFGAETAAAVREFQRNAGLVVDGICGPATLQAMERLGARLDTSEAVATVAEREALRRAPRTLAGRRLAVVDCGGSAALANALGRSLTRAGAEVIAVQHPDGSEQAAEANAAAVSAVVALAITAADGGCATAYYRGPSGESVGGRLLADLLQERLPKALGVPDNGSHGMSLPVLRETRMPAVLCEIGPAAAAVERCASAAEAIAAGFEAWAQTPWD